MTKKRKTSIWWRGLRFLLIVLLFLGLWWGLRKTLAPNPPPWTAEMRARAARTKILRDEWGIAHVWGESDADAAFALAWAHAEDDWPTIEAVLAAARGELSLIKIEERSLLNDGYVDLFGIQEQVESNYESKISPEFREILEAYAEGLNAYAADHPHEAHARLLPFRGKDIVAGFVHKLPFLEKLDKVLRSLKEDPCEIGQRIQVPITNPTESRGSNAHALAHFRSPDGVTRLNSNSHQPWQGPVAWHEAHIRSNQGWDAYGANFPGAPLILVGHNRTIAWTHTVNSPDLIDVYKLVTDPARPDEYKLDGEWLKFEEVAGAITIDTGLFDFTAKKRFLRSRHGPVIETESGLYAVRVAGFERLIGAAEQWFAMNKASNRKDFEAAMGRLAIPMFNTVFAEREHIAYYYNATIPKRVAESQGQPVDWLTVLPGDRSELIWTEYHDFASLPQVVDPACGFVQNCNSTPFRTTDSAADPSPETAPVGAGIESRQTNRAMRSIALLQGPGSIGRDEFFAMKWDRQVASESPMMKELVEPVRKSFVPQNPDEERALRLMRDWDGRCDEGSLGASLAVLSWRPYWFTLIAEGREVARDPQESFRIAVRHLREHFGRVEVALGELQRLRHDGLDLPMGGGPDIMNAFHGYEDPDGRLRGVAGDSFVLIVEFWPEGPRGFGIMNFGSSNRKGERHYSDQALLFSRRQLRRTRYTDSDLQDGIESTYRVGEEPRWSGQ